MKITFIYPKKAYLPELEGYRDYFKKKGFEVGENGGVYWYFMGFYLTRPKDKIVIHDYRSLSLQPHALLKDWAKMQFNSVPDLRIFLNEFVKGVLDFEDNVPYKIIDMGVNKEFLNVKRKTPEWDFVYVGSLDKEREVITWLETFEKYGKGKKLLVIGKADENLKKRFPSVDFYGYVPYKEVPDLLARCETGLAFVPEKYPYVFQTPTKLLEYASVGLKIVANRTPAIEMLSQKYNLEIAWSQARENWVDLKARENKKAKVPIWEELLENSRIIEWLELAKERH